MLRTSIILLLVIAVASCNQADTDTPASRSSFFIDSLMNQMTLSEKLGQLNLPSSGDITTGQASSSNVAMKIKEGKIGGLFNIRSAEKIREVQRVAVEESRLGIPLLFGMDVIHGYKTLFPIPLGLSCTWDMELIEESARIAAQEASADGICWTFSPMVDISRDPRWGRVSEGSGEDPYLGSAIAQAMVHGYQGDDLKKNNTIIACVKHFALYGASEAGRDYNTVDMGRLRMYNDYLPPYKAAVDAGVRSVMTSFNEVDGVPASANKWLIAEVLRNTWGFDGFVVTDYTAINEMVDHGIGDLAHVSQLALQAGVDMDMVGEGFLSTLEDAVNKGLIKEEEVNQACYRILQAKYDLGLFDDPYRYADPERAKTEVYTNENRNRARSIAAQSFVLLKNEGNLLPLQKSGSIAVIGPMGNNRENMAGTWSVAGDFKKSISLKEGIESVVGSSAQVRYARGANVVGDADLEARVSTFGKPTYRDDRTEDAMIIEAVALARSSDVIVAAIGEVSEMSGESSSRSNIEVPENQRRLMKALLATGKPLVTVLFTGRPLAMKWEDDNLPSILNVWFGGSEAGYAIADVLFGDVNPSGKITATFPQNVGQVPIFYSHKNTGRPLPDGKWFQKFRSNYLDVSNSPLYPFGYGLSYTTFEYNNLNISSDQINFTESVKISVELKNTGKLAGAEVVQLYIQDVVGSTTRPVKELKGFKKIKLAAGESQTIEFILTVDDLSFYHYDMSRSAEAGLFKVFVGGNSIDVLETKFTLTN